MKYYRTGSATYNGGFPTQEVPQRTRRPCTLKQTVTRCFHFWTDALKTATTHPSVTTASLRPCPPFPSSLISAPSALLICLAEFDGTWDSLHKSLAASVQTLETTPEVRGRVNSRTAVWQTHVRRLRPSVRLSVRRDSMCREGSRHSQDFPQDIQTPPHEKHTAPGKS